MKRNHDDVPLNSREREGSEMTEFYVHNITKFDGNFPSFQRPRCVGCYSLDDQRQYHPDDSQLRYLRLPSSQPNQLEWNVKFDLRRGIKNVVEKDQGKVKNHMLDDMLTWILQERTAKQSFVINVDSPLKTLETEFVCFRGLLTLISCTPYLPQDSWSLLAFQFQKTIYLWQLKEQDDCQGNPRLREMAVWGFKFEQYLCAGKPDEEPDPFSQLNTNSEFCCVVKTRLGGHSLLFGAEVDAVTKADSKPPWNSLEDFVELKTNRMIETQRQETSFRRFKLLKWWAQSFIVGIPTIVCGYRDDEGIVSKLESLSVQKLPAMAKGIWNPSVCMNFCQQFLEFVQKSVTGASDTHFIFEYDARRKAISVRRAAVEELPRPLLPRWYTEALSRPV